MSLVRVALNASEALRGATRVAATVPAWTRTFAADATASPPTPPQASSSGTAAAEASPGVSAEDLSDYSSILPKVVVFGGNGFVGSRVCQEALAMGLGVASINRSGRPRNLRGDWVDRVAWVQGDALDPQQPWREELRGALGVVSTLGAFGSNDFMYKVCGTANIRAMEAASLEGVPRFAFISVHDYRLPAGWNAENFLLRGYFKGKRDAERALAELYPQGGVALRPGAISGTRQVGTSSLPLGLLYTPMKAVLGMLPARSLSQLPIVGAAFVPPVKVEAVAKAAVNAVLDPSVPSGPMDVWHILEYERK